MQFRHSMKLLALVLLVPAITSACSSTATPSAPSGATPVSSGDTCKDFPVPIYPSTTSSHCEESSGHPSAFLESNDSVDQVTKFYETQVQSSGWQLKPDSGEGNSSSHAVVVITKGKGYASIIINPGSDGKGSHFQIHAYPNGN